LPSRFRATKGRRQRAISIRPNVFGSAVFLCHDTIASMSTAKTVQIRIGAVKRLTKEMKSRHVDVETEKKRTERLIAEGEDRWTVGKQVPILDCSCWLTRTEGSCC
jgi:hypothetical protein